MAVKIDKESFVTEEGILSFPSLFPGQAEDSQTPGSKSYKCELVVPRQADGSPGQAIVQAVSKVAQQGDANNWQRHVYGASGRLKTLEDMPGRDKSKYPYAVGHYILSFSKVISLKFLKMEGANLADPVQRANYDKAVHAAAPPVVRFANPNVPADLAYIEQENLKRSMLNQPPISPADYHKTFIPVRPDEIWAGCIVRIQGYAYWSETPRGKGPLFGLTQVLFVRPGERLAGAPASPDEAFGGFAPAADLAPPAPPAPPRLDGLQNLL